MRYNAHIFAGRLDDFGATVRNHASDVMQRVESWSNQVGFAASDQKRGLRLLEKMLAAEKPTAKYSDAHFWVLTWLCDAMLERVNVPSLNGVRHAQVLELIGFWPLLKQDHAPIELPCSPEFPPGAGYLRHAELKSTALPYLTSLLNDDGAWIKQWQDENPGVTDPEDIQTLQRDLQSLRGLLGDAGIESITQALIPDETTGKLAIDSQDLAAARAGRRELCEVLESISDDGLDVLIVVTRD